MKISNIAIIGAGGIGFRHIQSCCELSSDEFKLYIVDPKNEQLNNVKNNIKSIKPTPEIVWLNSIEEIPVEIDMAIVATCADVRAKIVKELSINNTKNILLEKVLFQTVEDYHLILKLIEKENINVWVNTPSRIFPSYSFVKDYIAGKKIRKLSIEGAGWDIGCNSIHYLDLFSFFAGSYNVDIKAIEVESYKEAKRKGMIHIEGCISGNIKCDAYNVPIEISSSSNFIEKRIVRILLDNEEVICEEELNNITVSLKNKSVKNFPLPFQSKLTAKIVSAIIKNNECVLTKYQDSILLHLPLIKAFIKRLYLDGVINANDRCPVT